ncbi:MAG: hypothetical protein ACI9WU_004323 [Myxococcota bacterium]|jgi:hypothetical protein
MGILAVLTATTDLGLYFRGYFVGDADEVIRAWYGRCAIENPSIIPYSHLSQPGWTALLAVGEGLARLLGLPLTLMGRLTTVLFSWWCLRSVARFITVAGGSWRMAVAAQGLLICAPGYFLLSLSVYPSIALAAVTAASLTALAQGKTTRAAGLIAWAPLLRWEGILLVALVGLFVLIRRSWRPVPWLVGPYLVWIAAQALRYGNPWKPLAYRTSKAMGAWLLFNPSVGWDRMEPALHNLVALWSPVVLVGGLFVGLFALFQGRNRLGRDTLAPVALGFGGLTIALLSIQHDWMVWALRVFGTPMVLGVMCIGGVAARVKRGGILLAVATVGVMISGGMAFNKLNSATIPPAGGFHVEVGFHMFVRPAQADDALAWLHEQEADWVISNHLNANLLRADETCSLYDLPLRLGSPRMSLSRDFVPVFGLPEGEGLVVFHTKAAGVEDCKKVAEFRDSRLLVYRCGQRSGEGATRTP